MAGIVAKHRYQMKFCNSLLTCNIFNLYLWRFFFGLVYGFDIRTNYTKPEASLTMRALLSALCIGARF